uniref:RRM domain-containing protein n=1 Tax=Alexandrium monilatum TaxID=311494 RepID=A0A7S4V1K6_9DINO
MALQCLERRLPPIGITFIDINPGIGSARQRRHSHGGFTPIDYKPLCDFHLTDREGALSRSNTPVHKNAEDNTLSTVAPRSPREGEPEGGTLGSAPDSAGSGCDQEEDDVPPNYYSEGGMHAAEPPHSPKTRRSSLTTASSRSESVLPPMQILQEAHSFCSEEEEPPFMYSSEDAAPLYRTTMPAGSRSEDVLPPNCFLEVAPCGQTAGAQLVQTAMAAGPRSEGVLPAMYCSEAAVQPFRVGMAAGPRSEGALPPYMQQEGALPPYMQQDHQQFVPITTVLLGEHLCPRETFQPPPRAGGRSAIPVGAVPPRRNSSTDLAPIGSPPGAGCLRRNPLTDGQIDAEVTTVMIRNLPLAIKQQELVDELDRDNFAGLYDFVYMPCAFQTGAGKGFAFVNFCSPKVVLAFASSWHRSRRLGLKPRDAQLNISPAEIQGLEANLARWSGPRMRRIRNPNLRPFTTSICPAAAAAMAAGTWRGREESSSPTRSVATRYTADEDSLSPMNPARRQGRQAVAMRLADEDSLSPMNPARRQGGQAVAMRLADEERRRLPGSPRRRRSSQWLGEEAPVAAAQSQASVPLFAVPLGAAAQRPAAAQPVQPVQPRGLVLERRENAATEVGVMIDV